MRNSNFKLYYSNRDFTLASNIMKILALNGKLSTKKISYELSDVKGGHTPPAIKIALERLVETGYVTKESIQHKTQTHNTWKLTCLGMLVSIVILHEDLDNFIINHANEKFYKMIYVLIKSSQRAMVKILIKRLSEINNDPLKIEKTCIEWYADTRNKVKEINNKIKFPLLDELQKKIKQDDLIMTMMKGRGKPDSNIYDTVITSICK